MPQSRTRSRAAIRSKYRKPKRRRGGSAWFITTIVLIVLVLGSLIVVSMGGADTATGAPHFVDQATNTPGDHWHTAFQVDICGEWLSAQPQFEKPADNPSAVANVGIHTHGDNLIHTHPFVSSEAGGNATLGKFAEYGGWSVSSDSFRAWAGPASKPKQTSWSNGDTCPFGQYKGQKGVLTWAVDGKQQTGNPSDYHMKNGETLAISFLPKGAEQPFPPAACAAFAGISDNSTAILSKSSPCRATASSTTAPTTTAPTTTAPTTTAPTTTSAPPPSTP